MSAIMLRQALGRAARALSSAGLRAEHTAAAQALADLPLPASDPCMRPYYDQVARMQVVPAASPSEVSESERAAELAMLRLHNSTCTPIYDGHMIKATVLEVGRRTVTLDTGLKPARVARSDLPPECIIGSTRQDGAHVQRKPGQLLEGDVVQVFLEAVGTPEGDFLVSGVQAAVQRRHAAVWNELEEKFAKGEVVKGRILNSVWGGYSVGVAGIVAFLPARQCARPTARRIGQLQKFRILGLDRSKPSLMLSDPNLHSSEPWAGARWGPARGGRGGGGPPSGDSPPHLFALRQPRTVEEAERRKELARVADELRSVLALRGGGSSEGAKS
ncbi:30S ribosomal S1 [Micractinium conductrix]|uniref:30S ribosomal S1 n=1 Tax=Micractinium conductrix TaxID=554055 RepID=A0A2P6VJG6_9CHLO|nr:30S ribosomal S1 [Micractinium conductrix]|eukprot:PSC74233.1 30S ribosomal S1 [Micractinium conductrix]